MQLLSPSDQIGPINGGLMLLRPSYLLYRDGLRVLRQVAFSSLLLPSLAFSCPSLALLLRLRSYPLDPVDVPLPSYIIP